MHSLLFLLYLSAHAVLPQLARSDGLLDQLPNNQGVPFKILFPNWDMVPIGRFDLYECPDATCSADPDCPIIALTLMNYGTALGDTDLEALYFNIVCGKTNAWGTMTYAQVWTVDGQDLPAWTWAGFIPWAEDAEKACASYPMLMVYADIAPCPTDGATVAIGLGFNDVLNPAAPGGLLDDCGYQVPSWDQLRAAKKQYLKYVVKQVDKAYAAPGDTLTYTIFYGSPGGPSIANYVIFDTLPAYTHYVSGSSSLPPDPQWNPDIGPPPRLRWTLPGVASTVGGRTAALQFSVTVDWGNSELCEYGSGDIAAPEGHQLDNRASVEFLGSGCGGPFMNFPVETMVRRYRTWKVADQDLLFAPRIGYNDDEVTFSIYIRNESSTRTWWNVSIWDTVPPELSTWAVGQGLYDPLLGWTMTPTGAGGDFAGWVESVPGITLLTWLFNLPPGGTREVQWKASASTGACIPGAAATTKVGIMELGAPCTPNGTGHAGRPRYFVHVAPIALRTTYFSYVGQAGNSDCAGLKINFYPLNKSTSFELRKLAYVGPTYPYAVYGGKSDTIANFQGTCGGFVDGGYGGCGGERAPAQYYWLNSCEEVPVTILYKLTGNAPLLWILMPEIGGGGAAHTYIPSTSLNFSGFCHYSYRRQVTGSSEAGYGESWIVANTSIGSEGDFDPELTTTAHIFRWDPGGMSWRYIMTQDIDKNSLWMPFDGCTPAEEGHYKIISSDARLLINQGYGIYGDPKIVFAYAEYGTYAPTAETGLHVSAPGEPATFYAIANHALESGNMIVGNHSATSPATFRVYHYRPRNPEVATQGIPPNVAGYSGEWDLVGTRVADPDITGATNAYVFGSLPYDPLTLGTGTTANAWKIEWVSGGNISVQTGINMFRTWSGGSTMHPSSGTPTGQDFWLHHANSGPIYMVQLFCPSAGMVIRARSGDGYDSSYTTDGPDQCISFTALTDLAWGERRTYRFTVDPDEVVAEVMAMYHTTHFREKFFTAPFVNTGLHYDVIAPAIVFTGQPFWITVAAILGDGATKVDYVGTSSFTSSDPDAQVELIPMDLYDYAWTVTDEGVKIFINVVLNSVGYVPIVVSDTLDGSITGLASIKVVAVDVKLTKEPRYAVASSGDNVVFKICWSNFSTGSATDFVITDAIPAHMTYDPDNYDAHFCGTPEHYGDPDVAYSTLTNQPSDYTDLPPGISEPPEDVRWLKWTIPVVAAKTTGCVCFGVKIE